MVWWERQALLKSTSRECDGKSKENVRKYVASSTEILICNVLP